MNGRGRGCVWPSTDTCRSLMASSKALCVRGVARLISSANTTLAKIGPGAKTELLRPRVVQAAAGDVGRQEVGRELDAVERAGHAAGHGLAHQCLAHPGHVFQQDVFAGQQGDHAQSHGLTLAQHHAADVSLELGNQIFGFGAHGGSIVVDETRRREREGAETCPHWARGRGCRFFSELSS